MPGADPSTRSDTDRTPLHEAALYHLNPAAISVLVDAGADPNARDHIGQTPLHEALEFQESPAVVQALLDSGADPNAPLGRYAVRP